MRTDKEIGENSALKSTACAISPKRLAGHEQGRAWHRSQLQAHSRHNRLHFFDSQVANRKLGINDIVDREPVVGCTDFELILRPLLYQEGRQVANVALQQLTFPPLPGFFFFFFFFFMGDLNIRPLLFVVLFFGLGELALNPRPARVSAWSLHFKQKCSLRRVRIAHRHLCLRLVLCLALGRPRSPAQRMAARPHRSPAHLARLSSRAHFRVDGTFPSLVRFPFQHGDVPDRILPRHAHRRRLLVALRAHPGRTEKFSLKLGKVFTSLKVV